MTQTQKYSSTAITLHWLIALMIAVAFLVGLYVADLELSPWKLKVLTWHKWTGVTIFLLVLFRILWRLSHRPPEMPAGMSDLMKKLAHLTHLAIYLLMVIVPILGWLHSSAAGVSVVYFNLITLPDLVGKDKALSHLFGELHENGAWALVGLVGLHVAAALKHQLVDKDNLLARMRW
ncbi:MAG: cytochrome b [Betaproteobacteria bacterium]|nr:cytochrome b [Betaproteobacteria bacterium]MDE2131192.1 cytochrome b [Betaproteobacteria bacterium]MDE2624238.1 cytochrome b [Betaproteobacteria bacterium]